MKRKVVFLALGAAVTAPTSAQAANERRCAAKESRTVATNEHARVFKTYKRKREPGNPSAPPRLYPLLYGCLYRTNKRSFLGTTFCFLPWGKVAHVRLTGGYVAYSSSHCEAEFGVADVSAVSLSSGLKREFSASRAPPPRSVPCEGAQCPIADPGSTTVTALEIKANGSFVWISQAHGTYFPVTIAQPEIYTLYEVRKAESSGKDVLLDSGADIFPTSLRLSRDGKTVHWTKGGVESFARLQ